MILLWDQATETPHSATLLSGRGLRVHFARTSSDFEPVSTHGPVSTYVLLAEARSALDLVPLVRRLASTGKPVVLGLRNLAEIAIAARCRLLLAGATCVLDAGRHDFDSELAQHVVDAERAEAVRAIDERRLIAMMAKIGVVGRSAATLSVFRSVARLSRLSDLSTLITGETGTGKELVARALHAWDPKRRAGPFVPVNCGALSSGVIESELFGHRRGSFTSAERDRKGLIRAAEGGVLFLDEIAELDLNAQATLLRVLQDTRVRAVGDDEEAAVNVRIVAATNRDLRAMVDRQEFRAELLHRLNVVSIHLPPLRERRDDVAALAEHFIDRHHALNPDAARTVDPDLIEALAGLELPGNVRQLENIVRSAIAQNDGHASIGLSDLPPAIWRQLADAPRGADDRAAPATAGGDGEPPHEYAKQLLVANGWNLARSLHSCERSILETALHAAGGNQSDVARRLGVTARSVYNMVRRHRLP